MPELKEVCVAICFNDGQQAREFSEKLSLKNSAIKFIINDQFENFVKELMNCQKIDLFLIEENFEAISAEEFLKKIKRTAKYKKTVTMIVEKNSKAEEFQPEFERLISNAKKPVIPENYHVLVLDNNPSVLEVISMHLDMMEHRQFDLCSTIADAKSKLVKKQYNVLLLDWNLDDGTCLDLIDFIKTEPLSVQKNNHQALAMVITGRNDVDDIMTLLRYGVKDHIIKPFDFDEFEDKVVYALEKYNKRATGPA